MSGMPVHASHLDFAMFYLLSVSLLQADVATVLRGKRLIVVPACDLVPGDIVDIAGGLAPNAQLQVCLIFTVTTLKEARMLTGHEFDT